MSERQIKGGALRLPANIPQAYARSLVKIIAQMTRETRSELVALFREQDVYERTAVEVGELVPAMDASIADLSQRIINRMLSKFSLLFESAAMSITERMASAAMRASANSVKSSLRDVAKDVTLEMTPVLAEKVAAASEESAGLIRRVPAKYLGEIQGDVMRSITTGNGLKDLVPDLEKRNVSIKNWAVNVAKDQTRKVYATINTVRMQEVGVKKFEWIHSGGSNQPRKSHITMWPAGLNGGIFSFDDPPIDPATGEPTMPGQEPFCGCTMRPVIDLGEL